MIAHSNSAAALPFLDLSLEHLSDDEVLAHTRRLVGRSNLLTAELLAHLAEVEARGIHRIRACSSLYAYPSSACLHAPPVEVPRRASGEPTTTSRSACVVGAPRAN
jgi:hypothetical protein